MYKLAIFFHISLFIQIFCSSSYYEGVEKKMNTCHFKEGKLINLENTKTHNCYIIRLFACVLQRLWVQSLKIQIIVFLHTL